jgi:hypothetical protein
MIEQLRLNWTTNGAAQYDALCSTAFLSKTIVPLFACSLVDNVDTGDVSFEEMLKREAPLLDEDVLANRSKLQELALHLRHNWMHGLAGDFRRRRSTHAGDSDIWDTIHNLYVARKTLQAVLMACAETEDLLHSFVHRDAAVERPKKLSDSLKDDLLVKTFGVPLVCIVRCIIGPFEGFNIRNVLCHGMLIFASK